VRIYKQGNEHTIGTFGYGEINYRNIMLVIFIKSSKNQLQACYSIKGTIGSGLGEVPNWSK